MKKVSATTITFRMYTDGDFAVDNDDGYFDVYNDYNYRIKIASKNIQQDIENIFKEVKSRVSCSREYFHKFFEELTPQSFYDNSNDLNPWDFDCGDFMYMGGNQDIMLFIEQEDDVFELEEQEKEEYKQFLLLSKKFKGKTFLF